ncbi:MAG TPA: hypothetical protein VFI20_06980 [Terracidiphilus sp.]|nr:hypothetical protein [Terracidiphilus sp.]
MTNPERTPGGEPRQRNSGESIRPQGRTMPPPGLAAISLYLLVLAAVIIIGVAGGHYPPLFLVFSAGFIAASAGMFLLLRWAWAGALAAVFLLACYNLWIFSTRHQAPAVVQGLLNLVFFLYLIRTEVRGKLR